jgi:hypothetical protein
VNSAQEKRSLSIGPGLVAYAAAATVYGRYLKPGFDMPELTRSSWEEIEGEGDRCVRVRVTLGTIVAREVAEMDVDLAPMEGRPDKWNVRRVRARSSYVSLEPTLPADEDVDLSDIDFSAIR